MKSTSWGVPNWQNPEQYAFADPKCETPLINDQLRWEFLRRDQSYREKWMEGKIVHSYFDLINPIDPKIPAKELDTSILFISSVMRGNLVNLSAPNTDTSDDFINNYGAHVLRLEQEGFLVLGFDPLYPTRPQIERATEILEVYRQKIIKERYDDAEESLKDGNDEKDIQEVTSDIIYRENVLETPQTLLRVLDAHNEGVSLQQIGQVIFLLTDDDAEGTSKARAVAHERLKSAKTCWKRITPHSRNVVL